jgi:DNA-binding transcriptional ArsR family regulator
MSSKDKQTLIFKALADDKRREILDLLKASPKTTGDLCDHFKRRLDRCTVMQHLGVLEAAGLLIVRKEGRVRWNYLDAVPIKNVYDRWLGPLTHHATGMLSQLKNDLEKTK